MFMHERAKLYSIGGILMLRTALLFPGQGSQFIGMCSDLYKQYYPVRHVFQEASDVLGFDLYKLCSEGDPKQLIKTENAQPAVLTTSVAAYRVFVQEIGVNPLFYIGHSLGEISALTCAKAFKFSDAVRIVHMRGKFMQEAVRDGVGAMLAIILDEVELEEWTQHECEKYSTQGLSVCISNYNSKKQLTISGNREAVKKIGNKMKARGAKVIPLKVSAPFHCCLMQPAADKLKDLLESVEVSDLSIPVISNVDAKPYHTKEAVKSNMHLQMTSSVQWFKSMQYACSQGISLMFELGPKAVLRQIMRDIADKTHVIPITDCESVDIGKNAVEKGIEEEIYKMRQAKFQLINKCLAAVACTKNNNLSSEQYNQRVVTPNSQLSLLSESIEKNGSEPTVEQLKGVLETLKAVFLAKQVPLAEQKERFAEIFMETGLGYLFPEFCLDS